MIARMLGPSGRGVHAVALAIGAIGVQVGNIGCHAAQTFYVAKDRRRLAPFIANSVVLAFGVASVSVLLLWACAVHWPRLAPIHGLPLSLGLMSVPLGLGYLLFQHLLIGIQEVRAYNVIETVNRVILALLVAVLFLVGHMRVETALTAMLIAVAICAFWSFRKLVAQTSVPVLPSIADFKGAFGFGLRAYLTTMLGFLLLRFDLLMVQYMKGSEQAGYYSIAATMADTISTLPAVAATIIFPRLSACEDPLEGLRLVNKTTLLVLAFMIPFASIACLVAKPLVSLAFGAAFAPVVPAFIWLMPGIVFLGIESVMVQWLNSLGLPLAVVGVWATSLVCNIAVNFWAIPAMGIVGASIASSICYLLVLLFVLLIIKSHAAQLRRDRRIAALSFAD